MSKSMTVKSLIDLLQHVPDKTLLVKLEGCDCSALAIGVSLIDGAIMLRRHRGTFADNNDDTHGLHRAFGDGEGEIFASTFPITNEAFIELAASKEPT